MQQNTVFINSRTVFPAAHLVSQFPFIQHITPPAANAAGNTDCAAIT
jgi:hypothetical protein